jgi:hypothetical protein
MAERLLGNLPKDHLYHAKRRIPLTGTLVSFSARSAPRNGMLEP